MTTPNQPKPNGAYTLGGGTSGGKWGESWTDQAIKDFTTGATRASADSARAGYEAAALDPQNVLSDRVQALINDVNLLNGVPAYGAVYQSWNIGMDGTGNWRLLPFNSPVGPRKRVDIFGAIGAKDNGGLTGYDPGLWELSVLTHLPFALNNVGAPQSGILLQIVIYDSPTHVNFFYQTEVWDSGNGGDKFSIQATYPFVVPTNTHHFNVNIFAQSGQLRQFAGGTKFSGLWLRRISSDVANTTIQQTVPDA